MHLFKPGSTVRVGLPTLLFLGMAMKMNDMEAKVTTLISPILEGLGVDLYCVHIPNVKGRGLVRVFIEKEGGITIEDCQRVSREIEAIFDVEDPMPGPYTLEVSSPGLDRPLMKPDDFKKVVGQSAQVVTLKPVGKQKFFVGKILSAGEVDIVMLLPKDRHVVIGYENISRARLEVTI